MALGDGIIGRMKRSDYTRQSLQRRPAPAVQLREIKPIQPLTPPTAPVSQSGEPLPLGERQTEPHVHTPHTFMSSTNSLGDPSTKPGSWSIKRHVRSAIQYIPPLQLSKKIQIGLPIAIATVLLAGILFRTTSQPNVQPSTLGAATVADGFRAVRIDQSKIAPYQKILDFPLFFPTQLPNAYHLKEDSYTTDQSLFSFVIEKDDKRTVIVSEQAIYADFVPPVSEKQSDLSSFASQSFETIIGPANVIARKDRIIGYITTDSTMLIFNITGIPTDDAKAIMSSFVSQ